MSYAKHAFLNPKQIDFPYVDSVIAQIAKPSPLHPVRALFHFAGHALLRNQAVVHYISDNGLYADTAPGEIRTRLNDARMLLQSISGRPAPHVEYHDIPPQDTYAAAFDLAQLARGAVRGFGNVFFVNCAPRKKQRGKEGGNGGEPVYAGILPNGAIIAGTGEEAFVHFKDLVAAGELNLYRTRVATGGTQFRSRDYFTWLAVTLGNHVNRLGVNRRWKAGLSLEQRDAILFGLNVIDRDARLSAGAIPDLPNNGAVVARSDTHGNLKLGLRHPDIVAALGGGENPEAVVIANDRALRATVATNSFDKPEGITVISAGSSGQWQDADGRTLAPIAEVFTVGGRARSQLGISDGQLKAGTAVHIVPRALFDAALDRIAKAGAEASDDDVASALAASGFVKGLDHASLRDRLGAGDFGTELRGFLPEPRGNVVSFDQHAGHHQALNRA